jgi:sugar/nucleoside kinase (ribokinase family)
MKDIQLTGLGNGLIDLQYRITEADVSLIGLEKGAMILVDDETYTDLIFKIKDRTSFKCSGGSAANTLIAFSGFGGKGAYKTVLGKDEFGDYYESEFRELNIELFAERNTENPTGICSVFITPDSERTMYTHLGATALFSDKNINEEAIARSEWLYIEGYKFSEDSSTKAIEKSIEIAKKHGTKVSVTFSDKFIIDIFRDNLEKAVNESDLVFCNEHEAIAYTGKDNPRDAFEELTKICPNAAMTLGPKGSLIKWNGELLEIPAYKVEAVDTTGAGDMYAGAFFYGILNGHGAEFAGHLASYASARVVAQMGARLDADYNEIKEFVSNTLKNK